MAERAERAGSSPTNTTLLPQRATAVVEARLLPTRLLPTRLLPTPLQNLSSPRLCSPPVPHEKLRINRVHGTELAA